MLRIIILCLAVLAINSTRAQRHLETVRSPAGSEQQNTAYNGKILIGVQGESFLLSYDDVSFTSHAFPIVGGSQLRFYNNNNPLTVFQSAVFLRLTTSTGTASYLYRFNGTSFSRIIIPGNMIANCVVYGTYLYFLSNVSGTIKLYRYNGSVSEVPASLPNAGGHKLHVAGGYLYITGYAISGSTANFIRRYNGSGFLTLPYSGPGTNVSGIYHVPGTVRAYFTSHERILYYDGSTVRQVFYNVGEPVFARMWRNKLYFTTGVGSAPGRTTHLYRLNGTALTAVTMPGAVVAPVPHSNPEIYDDALYIGAVYPDGSKRLLRYNESSFTSVLDITSPVSTGIHLFLREGSLMIQPHYINGTNAYEYNGSTFTEIIAPAGKILFPYMNSTACTHLWLNYQSKDGSVTWSYAKEDKGCPPPAPAPAPVIPAHFKDYERFEITAYGPGRGWCWSDIIIDWDIVPYCPLPPCPDPNYEIRMTDPNNSTAWMQKFTSPTALQVPLQDIQGYRTTLSTPDNGWKDLVVFEPNLPEKGIGSIKLTMYPKNNYVLLSAATKNNQSVALRATLYNANGAVLWQQTFMAPFTQQINTLVQEPGQRLVFSIPDLVF